MKFLNKYYVLIWTLLLILLTWFIYAWRMVLFCDISITGNNCFVDWGFVITMYVLVSIVYNVIYSVVYFVKKRI